MNTQNMINKLVVDMQHTNSSKQREAMRLMIVCIKNGTIANIPTAKVEFWRTRYMELKNIAYPQTKPVIEPKPYVPLQDKHGIQHTDACFVLYALDKAQAEVEKYPRKAAWLLDRAVVRYLAVKGETVLAHEWVKQIKNIPTERVASALAKFDAKMRPEMQAANTCVHSFKEEPALAG